MTRRRAEGRAVLRPRPRHGQVRAQHTPMIRQPVRSRYGHGGLRHARHTARRGVGHGAQGRGARRAGERGTARRGSGHGARGTALRDARMSVATRRLGLRYDRRPRPLHGQACPRYGQACARLGVPVRAWVC